MSLQLHYVTDTIPGIRRKQFGRHFRYCCDDGTYLKDKAELNRIRALAIPPAWTEVWICPLADGHLQATGRDARGRKQYLYHASFREMQESWKYERLIPFAESLPAIRARVRADLAQSGLPRTKVLAAVVRLLETTAMRIGNKEYARQNRSFGLTTLHNKHAQVKGEEIRFKFRGKSSQEHEIDLRDPQLARIVRQCQDLPGQELFGYLDEDGEARDVGSADVNDYLREISGQDLTAKDFRTWTATFLAIWALDRRGSADTQAAARRNINEAISEVAEHLGNTRAICRKSYIHPAVLEAYLSQTLTPLIHKHLRAARKKPCNGLTVKERAVLGMLKQWSTSAPVAKCLPGKRKKSVISTGNGQALKKAVNRRLTAIRA